MAIYARRTISNTALANAANPGSPNPIPSAFYGYYVQGAYELWQRGDYRLNPFARYELYNMGGTSGYSGPVLPWGSLPPRRGRLRPWPQNHDRV